MDSIKHPSLSQMKEDVQSIKTLSHQMNLSQKQLSDLLKVDPASLSRWSKDPEKIPSYIWNALYLLKIQYGGLTIDHGRDLRASNQSIDVEEIMDQVKNEGLRLKAELEEKEKVALGWKSLLIINTIILLMVFLYKYL